MRNRTILFLYLALVFAMPSLFATVQHREMVIINNDTLYIKQEPLEMLFEDNHAKETFTELTGEWPMSTACYRGYTGVWEVKGKTLLLRALYDCQLKDQIDLKKMFGNKCRNGSVKADWYSGSIYCLKYMSPPASGTMRKIKEQGVFITKGRVDSIVDYDLSKIQYSNYVDDNSELMKYVYKRINWKKIPTRILSDTTAVVVLVSGNENAIVDSVQVLKSVNEEVDAQIISILKTLPAWSVNYEQNKFDRVYQRVTIYLNDRIRIHFAK